MRNAEVSYQVLVLTSGRFYRAARKIYCGIMQCLSCRSEPLADVTLGKALQFYLVIGLDDLSTVRWSYLPLLAEWSQILKDFAKVLA